MRLTKESAAAILAFTSSVAALPHFSQETGESNPTVHPATWHAKGFANNTHVATPTGLQNGSSSSTHAASPTGSLVRCPIGPEHKKLIELAVFAEEGAIFEGLGCINKCWTESKRGLEDGANGAYGECIDHCKTPTKIPFAGKHLPHNVTGNDRAHKVIIDSVEVGVQVRNDIVDYMKCLVGKEREACIGAVREKSISHKGWIEYGSEGQEITPAVNTTIIEPVVAVPTTMPAKESSKAKESATWLAEAQGATATDVGMGDASASSSSSIISVAGRPSPYPVEA